MKIKTFKLWGVNIGDNLYDFGVGKTSLNKIQNKQTQKKRLINISIKLRWVLKQRHHMIRVTKPRRKHT